MEVLRAGSGTGSSDPPLTIGFLSPFVHGYYFGSLLAGVLEVAGNRGGRVVAIQTIDAGLHLGSFPENRFTPEVAWQYIDAFVVVQAAVSDAYLAELSRTGKPIVTICREIVDFDCPAVVPDNRAGIATLVDHLIAHGHQRIAYAGRDPADSDDQIRQAAYRAELLARGLEPYEAVIVPWLELGRETNAVVAKALLGAEVLPTAVVACTDMTAMRVVEALSEAGVAVPRDMAVVGFDDIKDAASHQPPLTTVTQDFGRIGGTACGFAFDALEGHPATAGYHCMPVPLMTRESCGCPAQAAERGTSSGLGGANDGSGGELAATDSRAPGGAAVADVGARLEDGRLDGHRRHYQISTELVRRNNPNSRSLAWLSDTEEVRAGCLALWDGAPGDLTPGADSPGDDVPGGDVPGDDVSGERAPADHAAVALNVVGTYSNGEAYRAVGNRCGVRDFPPAAFVDLFGDRPGDLLYLVSVRFDGSDWGFLALIGAFDVREQSAFEMYNHWAVLLAVSLDRQRVENRLRGEALFDVLTGLPNRTLFMDRLNQAIELSHRRAGYWFAVVFLDLNGFKLINDSLGHHVGDEVLRRVAERLTSGRRANDTVARFGGDEFVLLLTDVADPRDLPSTVSRILTLVSAPLEVHERTFVVRFAAGIATNVTGQRSADDYIRDADMAMYKAKTTGNDMGQLFDNSMHVGAMERLQLESDLRRAVMDNEFELYYQPIFRLADRRLDGAEALIRWHHPTRGLLLPDEFLPVAESTGLIRRIGRWTVRQACQQVRAWRDDFPDSEEFPVSVNLSNHQFWDPDLRSYMWQALADFDVPPSALVFELTEGVIMHSQEAAVDAMEQLHADSIKLHVDDFGTGHSSLATVHTFPVDALKIDRSFVGRMKADPRSRAFVRIMIDMGTSLGIEVIAEGIETDDEAAMLSEMGCPRAQGHLFSRPAPAGGIPRFFLPRSVGGAVPVDPTAGLRETPAHAESGQVVVRTAG